MIDVFHAITVYFTLLRQGGRLGVAGIYMTIDRDSYVLHHVLRYAFFIIFCQKNKLFVGINTC